MRWQAATGGGRISPDSSLTNGYGVARARWVLGPSPGAQTAIAWVSFGTTNVATFHATATLPPPHQATFTDDFTTDRAAGWRVIVQTAPPYVEPSVEWKPSGGNPAIGTWCTDGPSGSR